MGGKTIVFLICCVFSTAIWSQNNWETGYIDDDVKISYRKTECERKDNGTHIEYYYLKIENLSENTVSLEFKKEMWYNNTCLTCNSDNEEYIVHFQLGKNEILEGDCFNNTDKKLRVFSKMLNFKSKSVLTDFRIENVKVIEIE